MTLFQALAIAMKSTLEGVNDITCVDALEGAAGGAIRRTKVRRMITVLVPSLETRVVEASGLQANMKRIGAQMIPQCVVDDALVFSNEETVENSLEPLVVPGILLFSNGFAVLGIMRTLRVGFTVLAPILTGEVPRMQAMLSQVVRTIVTTGLTRVGATIRDVIEANIGGSAFGITRVLGITNVSAEEGAPGEGDVEMTTGPTLVSTSLATILLELVEGT